MHTSRHSRKAFNTLRTLALIVAAGALVGCQQLSPPGGASAANEVPSVQTPEPAAVASERIASLSYETTEILAELGVADRIVLMPESVLNPALGSHQAELAAVEGTYAVEMELTAEAVIEAAPELVLMTPRHGSERATAEVLDAAGITTLMMPNSWSTVEDLVANVRVLGETVGASERAEALANELAEGLTPRTELSDESPGVLVLSNQAGRPFVTGGTAFPLELLGLAGARDLSAELGIEKTGPIQAEQVIAARPDGILLIDMNGSGERLFSELLETEGVRQLPALTEGRVLQVSGADVQALGLTRTIAGLDTLTEWVATLK